jgi:hypothetical protein
MIILARGVGHARGREAGAASRVADFSAKFQMRIFGAIFRKCTKMKLSIVLKSGNAQNWCFEDREDCAGGSAPAGAMPANARAAACCGRSAKVEFTAGTEAALLVPIDLSPAEFSSLASHFWWTRRGGSARLGGG